MKKLLIILLALFTYVGLRANDGAYYSNGNHLIPITETTIRVQKEILTITRIYDSINEWGSLFKVNVYYKFFNPGEAKDLIVGFESSSPDGNAYDGSLDEAFAGQPFIYDFNVVMNGKPLSYQLAHVPYQYEGDYQFDYSKKTEDYYRNGQIQDMTKEQYSKSMAGIFEDEEEYLDWFGYLFYYVYHFNAHFDEGLNTIQHTYLFKGASFVMMDYLFDYILTAANRWANNGIDDFTLVLNMGDHTSFTVQPTFFTSASEWTFNGKGKVGSRLMMTGMCEDCPMFHMQSGSLVFHKKNFHPEGELHIEKDALYIFNYLSYEEDGLSVDDVEDFVNILKTEYYNLYLDVEMPFKTTKFTDEQKRILKNMPFAYRGYVFKSKDLQNFFESTEWYVPDPDYKSDMTKLHRSEKEWVQFWSK